MYTKEQQKEHRKQWIAALRSGDYKQVIGSLKTNQGYCCLGVATEICPTDEFEFNTAGEYQSKLARSISWPSPTVMCDYFGLRTDEGRFDNEGDHTSLAEMNDEGNSFKEIAQIIEDEPEGLIK